MISLRREAEDRVLTTVGYGREVGNRELICRGVVEQTGRAHAQRLQRSTPPLFLSNFASPHGRTLE